ncbi:MAG: hypothetical protein RI558_07520 [Psychroflexus sp.]|nr:hypothetical protein [Psychroflexus sp.]MDR9448964.1 hypothetical protein [Psychroflexus sp.]
MKTYRFFNLFILIISLLITSCSDDDTGQEVKQSDNLEQHNVLGEWQLEVRTINGITDAAVECCDFITFSTDDIKNDLSGNFSANGTGYETNGTFDLNPTESIIQFNFDNEVLIYNYEINGNALSFTYEEDGDAIEELWRKQ